MKIPLVIIVFNRPKETKLLFNEIKKYKPKKLFIISDGPRKNSDKDKKNILVVREIFKNISWKCKLYKNYSNSNLGTKQRIISGISWVFKHVDEAIFLEDDCIPNRSFFLFMEEMLNKYRNNLNIGSICGTNLFDIKTSNKESYFFSKYQDCWGWATWKNRWLKLDKSLNTLENIKQKKYLYNYLGSYRAYLYWHWKLNKVKNNELDSWSFLWTYTGFIKKYLHIIPKVNLVKNTGFGLNASRTKINNYNIRLKNNNKNLSFPLTHPKNIINNIVYDKYYEDIIFSKSLKNRIIWLIKIMKTKILNIKN